MSKKTATKKKDLDFSAEALRKSIPGFERKLYAQLRKHDPLAYFRLKAEVEADKVIINQRSELLRLIPKWNDPIVRQREATWVLAYLLGRGIAYNEAVAISDARRIFEVYKDMQKCLAFPNRAHFSRECWRPS